MSVKEIDRGWKSIQEQLKLMEGKPQVAIGVRGSNAIEKKKNADGSQGDFELWEIATVHEYGSDNARIPERSFIRATIDANEKEYNELKKKLVKAILTPYSKVDVFKGLAILGEKVKLDIQARIRAGLQPPWSETTREERINRAGGAIVAETPLIDTGQLLSGITYEVEKKERKR